MTRNNVDKSGAATPVMSGGIVIQRALQKEMVSTNGVLIMKKAAGDNKNSGIQQIPGFKGGKNKPPRDTRGLGMKALPDMSQPKIMGVSGVIPKMARKSLNDVFPPAEILESNQ